MVSGLINCWLIFPRKELVGLSESSFNELSSYLLGQESPGIVKIV